MTNELKTSDLVNNITAFIGQQQDYFVSLNRGALNQLSFERECEFAKQMLLKNDYTLGVARSNPDSLHAAISNVAAIGITLNPALAFAYLVPRKIKGKGDESVYGICLDISYRGLIKLATDTGIIKAMKAELVYANDKFEYHGFHEKPVFSANPFGERGELIGVYAMALLADGSYLVEAMSAAEVNAVRDSSEAYKSAIDKGGWFLENCVWVKFYTEMVKKTVIKRAYKTLPTSKGMEILGKAVAVINEHEGMEFDPNEPELHYSEEEREEYQRCITERDWFNLFALSRSLSVDGQLQLYNLCMPEAEKGGKGRQKEQLKRETQEAGMEMDAVIVNIRQALDENQDMAVIEILSVCSKWAIDHIMNHLNNEQQMQLNKLRGQDEGR